MGTRDDWISRLPVFLPPETVHKAKLWLKYSGKDAGLVSNDIVVFRGTLSYLPPDRAGLLYSPFMLGNYIGLRWSDELVIFP